VRVLLRIGDHRPSDTEPAGLTETVAVIVIVGATVVGSTVVGATVVGATVVGATVVGATVVGATVVGATVVGATVVGEAVAVGVAVVAVAVGVAVVAVGVAEVVALAVVGATVVGATVAGLTVGPVVGLVVGLSRALMIGEIPAGVVPGCLAAWATIALGLPLELPLLPLAWTAAGDSIGSEVGAGQLAALHAMNPLEELLDWDAFVPYQQMSVIAPRTPVPMTRFRTECGRW
jgi:hypothetical protein